MEVVKAANLSKFSETVTLHSSDGPTFQVEPKVALKSKWIERKLSSRQEKDRTQPITLESVRSATLRAILEWAEFHKDEAEDDFDVSYDEGGAMRIGLDEWDREFLVKYDKQRFIMVEAAIQLEINDLKEIICQSIAETIRGKTPEEIRQFFGLKKEFTPDEEAKIKRQNNESQLFEAILR